MGSLFETCQRAARPTATKVAILAPSTLSEAKASGTSFNGFLSAFTELGYIDGHTVTLEFRFAEYVLECLPALAAELVAGQPDVLWTWTSAGALAATAATSTIPIVIAPVNEAIMAGLVANFARPSGNVTGLTNTSRVLQEKCLQLLKEAVPRVKRVAFLVNPLNPAWRNYPGVLLEAAQRLGLELIRVEARSALDLDQAFASMNALGTDSLFVVNDNTFISAPVLGRIVEWITSSAMPAVSDNARLAQAGGLLSVSTNDAGIARQGAFYAHRIIQGARPGDLPVQFPSEFPISVNMKSAKALAIEVPSAFLPARPS